MRRSAFAVLLLAAVAAVAAGCGNDQAGPPSPQPAASVDGVRAEAERATGVPLAPVDVAQDVKAAGIAAVYSSGPDAVEGQRIVVTVGIGDEPNAVDEPLLAQLGRFAGIDVDSTRPASGWGTKVIRGRNSPVFIVYWAEAATKEDLAALDRSKVLNDAMVPFGHPDDGFD